MLCSRLVRFEYLLRWVAALLPGLSACGGALAEPVEASETAHSHELTTLRVVTFNTWMVPFRHAPDLPRRISRAIAPLDADVVALQEVWRARDARALGEQLRLAGYPWVRWQASDAPLCYASAGLLIASRLPMVGSTFTPYDAGTLPLVPWQPDWLSRKGWLSVDVSTSAGLVRIVTTHAQADYTTRGYDLVRMSQMAQLGRAVADSPYPVVVAGDVNVRPGEAGRRVLVHSARLTELEAGYGVDAIFFRGAATVALHEARSEPVLEHDAQGRLSDHRGILAVLDVAVGSAPPVDELPGPDAAIEGALRSRGIRLRLEAALALLAAAGVPSILRAVGRWWRRASPTRTLVLAGVGMAAVWCTYYFAIYAPASARWLAQASRDLERAR